MQKTVRRSYIFTHYYIYTYITLFESPHAKHVDFLLCEISPVASSHVLLGKTGELYTVELDYTVAETLENALCISIPTCFLSRSSAYSIASACISPSSSSMPSAIFCISSSVTALSRKT